MIFLGKSYSRRKAVNEETRGTRFEERPFTSLSREAAEECSPYRYLWVEFRDTTKSRRSERKPLQTPRRQLTFRTC